MVEQLSIEAVTVLRALAGDPRRSFDGAEVLERIFASTMERPMDPAQICNAVRDLAKLGLVVSRPGGVDPDYDFATVQITGAGLKLWRG